MKESFLEKKKNILVGIIGIFKLINVEIRSQSFASGSPFDFVFIYHFKNKERDKNTIK